MRQKAKKLSAVSFIGNVSKNRNLQNDIFAKATVLS